MLQQPINNVTQTAEGAGNCQCHFAFCANMSARRFCAKQIPNIWKYDQSIMSWLNILQKKKRIQQNGTLKNLFDQWGKWKFPFI